MDDQKFVNGNSTLANYLQVRTIKATPNMVCLSVVMIIVCKLYIKYRTSYLSPSCPGVKY